MVALALIEDEMGGKSAFFMLPLCCLLVLSAGVLPRLKRWMRAGKCMRDSHGQYFQVSVAHHHTVCINLC